MYDHESLRRQLMQGPPSYEEFLKSLEFDNKGRALLGGYNMVLGHGPNNTHYLQRNISYIHHIKELEANGYIVQSLDVSNNFFIIKKRLFVYKPEKKLQAWIDRNPWKVFFMWIALFIFTAIALSALAIYHYKKHGL